jgi:hypothetical protein
VNETARLLLMLALAGAAVTFVGSALIWVMDPARRLQRAFKQVLAAPPEAMLLSPSTGRGAGVAFQTDRLAVCWSNGAWCLVYRLDELTGAELLIDGQVVGRALRGEPSRTLDRAGGASDSVVLRLVFDDPRNPDFEVELWTRSDALRREAPSPAEAIAEANSWLARTEALIRRPRTAAPAPVVDVAPGRPPPPRREPPDDEDETDELPF